MTPTLRRKLEALAERREELQHLLSDPDVVNNNDRFRTLSRELSQLEPVAVALEDEARAKADLSAAEAMRNDPEMREPGRRGDRRRTGAPGRTGCATGLAAGTARPAR